MNRLNKTESAVFLYCRFSLVLKDPFFQIILMVRDSEQLFMSIPHIQKLSAKFRGNGTLANVH